MVMILKFFHCPSCISPQKIWLQKNGWFKLLKSFCHTNLVYMCQDNVLATMHDCICRRNLHFWRTTFYFDFLRFFTKPFILPKINSVATWYLIGPLKTSIYISCIILSISSSTMNEKFNFKISDSSNGRHPV